MEAAGLVGGRPREGFARWAALAGAVYVVLFVIGTLVMYSSAPNGDKAPGKYLSWYGNKGNLDKIRIAWVLLGLSIFSLLWFIAALRRSVSITDRTGLLTTVVGIGGTVYAACALVAVALEQGVRTMSDDTFQHQVYPPLIHAADDAAWVIHASGAAGLAAMIIAASYTFMARRTWPRWAGWVGIIVGVVALASVAFFPQWLWLLWILIVSILMFLRPERYEPVTTM